MRMAMTAKSIANARAKAEEEGRDFRVNDMTAHNVKKVTRFREGGERDLEEMVERFERLRAEGDEGVDEVKKRRVYHENPRSR